MKILFVKTSALGDIIHAFTALAYVRKRFPDAEIDWVVEEPFAELVRAHPGITRVYTINSRKWRKSLFSRKSLDAISDFKNQLRENTYDVVFDLQGNIKSGLVTAVSLSKNKVGFAWKCSPEWPNTLFTNKRFNPPAGKNIREDYLYLVQSYFQDTAPFEEKGVRLKCSVEGEKQVAEILENPLLKEKKKVLVCGGSNWKNKQIPKEALADFLRKNNTPETAYLFAWGTPQEKEEAEWLVKQFSECSILLDRLPLPLLQKLMSAIDLVVSMDSLPLHLCGTTATPTFSFFGPSSAKKYKPLGAQHQSKQGACPYGRTFEKRCPVLRTCPTAPCTKSQPL